MSLCLQNHVSGLRMSRVYRHPFRDRSDDDYELEPYNDRALPVRGKLCAMFDLGLTDCRPTSAT